MRTAPDARRRLMAMVRDEARGHRGRAVEPRRPGRVGWIAATLALAGAVVALALVRLGVGDRPAPAAKVVGIHGTAHAPALHGSLVWLPDQGLGFLRVAGLPPAPTSWVYRVWAIRDGASEPAGVLRPAGRRRFEAALAHLGGVATLAITAEPDANRTAPSGAEVAFISLPGPTAAARRSSRGAQAVLAKPA